MTTQPTIEQLADELESTPFQSTRYEAAAELRRLEAANAELLAALKMNAQALSWLAFGECRGFTDDLPTALEATDAARAAIKKHGGAE